MTSQATQPGVNLPVWETWYGTNDVFPISIKGQRFLAAQEPLHGDQIVIYAAKGGHWERREIFRGFIQGHEIAVGGAPGGAAVAMGIWARSRGSGLWIVAIGWPGGKSRADQLELMNGRNEWLGA